MIPSPDNSLGVRNGAIWEKEFERIPGVSRIDENNFHHLQQLLVNHENIDSYLTSPIYYAYTGRKGLWAYENGNKFLLICWHPNVDDQILIFPQLTECTSDFLAELLAFLPEPENGVRLARINRTHDIASPTLALTPREETVLDWKYPVHILSTDMVAELAGNKFMHTRNRLRQLKDHSTQVQPFDAVHHSRALENLLHRWAAHNATCPEEYENLYSPYDSLFSQSMDKSSGLSGLLFFVNDVLQAVSLWDISNVQQKCANLFVNICNTDIRGLSELLTVKSCETLRDQGIKYLNLGGSEWEGLDTYKRKFCPAFSIPLCSADIELKKSRPILRVTERQQYA